MNLGIVIQGPPLSLDLNRRMRDRFGNNIVFSTWKGKEEYFESSDHVVFSHLPENRGPMNLNCQKILTICNSVRIVILSTTKKFDQKSLK